MQLESYVSRQEADAYYEVLVRTDERRAIVEFIRRSAATLLTSDMEQMADHHDRRELECAARAAEVLADEIESGAHRSRSARRRRDGDTIP